MVIGKSIGTDFSPYTQRSDSRKRQALRGAGDRKDSERIRDCGPGFQTLPGQKNGRPDVRELSFRPHALRPLCAENYWYRLTLFGHYVPWYRLVPIS